ncbi:MULTISPECIES: hypothetical protein [Giesbergeria]|uniref:Uncharacterized protein n=1 Tax=Giesbergeria sinuosa TaxID=80883 RepID=A0ABV9QBV7_9BURK
MATTQRPAFKINHPASIKHINVRKEGEEGNEVLALDLKLVFKGLDRNLCAYFDEALEAFLWRGDTEALIVRNDFLSPVQYANYVSGACVHIGGRDFDGSESPPKASPSCLACYTMKAGLKSRGRLTFSMQTRCRLSRYPQCRPCRLSRVSMAFMPCLGRVAQHDQKTRLQLRGTYVWGLLPRWPMP